MPHLTPTEDSGDREIVASSQQKKKKKMIVFPFPSEEI